MPLDHLTEEGSKSEQHLRRVITVIKTSLAASDRANEKLHRRVQSWSVLREVQLAKKAAQAENYELSERLREAEARAAGMQAAIDAAGDNDKRMRVVREQRDQAISEAGVQLR